MLSDPDSRFNETRRFKAHFPIANRYVGITPSPNISFSFIISATLIQLYLAAMLQWGQGEARRASARSAYLACPWRGEERVKIDQFYNPKLPPPGYGRSRGSTTSLVLTLCPMRPTSHELPSGAPPCSAVREVGPRCRR